VSRESTELLINQGMWLICGYHQSVFTDIVTWRDLSNCSLKSRDPARGSPSWIVTKIAHLARRQFYKLLKKTRRNRHMVLAPRRPNVPWKEYTR